MIITVTTERGKTYVGKWTKRARISSLRGNVITFPSGRYEPEAVPRELALAQMDTFLRRRGDSRVTPAD